MNRETKTFTTPLSKALVIKSYMTAREREDLLSIFSDLDRELLKKEADGSAKASLEGVKSAKKYIEIMLVSYDGATDIPKIVETLLDSPVAEYDFILEACVKAATGDFQPVK